MIKYIHQDKEIIKFNNFDICIDDNYTIIIYCTHPKIHQIPVTPFLVDVYQYLLLLFVI